MRRIIIDSRSNRLFRGIEIDQSYDQRGGLCQVGLGHLAVTTNPINGEYLDYWKHLGFTLPEFLTAGPFDPAYTLSELIMQKTYLQDAIKAFACKDGPARLEFSYIESSEQALSEILGLPAYCNFDVSLTLSRKLPFKQACQALSLPTPEWIFYKEHEALLDAGKQLVAASIPFVIKLNDGTGGIPAGGMFKITSLQDLEAAFTALSASNEEFFIEHIIGDKMAEISLHWEISESGELLRFDLFNQIEQNFSYYGVSYPANLPPSVREDIESQLKHILYPYLVHLGAQGFFCCDLIVDLAGTPHWLDFNPRKGGILYVWDAVERIAQRYFPGIPYYFWHEHEYCFTCGDHAWRSFLDITRTLRHLLSPEKRPFILITNPGILQFGNLDIIGISTRSIQEARDVFESAKDDLK